jgi:hypothetical protein
MSAIMSVSRIRVTILFSMGCYITPHLHTPEGIDGGVVERFFRDIAPDLLLKPAYTGG